MVDVVGIHGIGQQQGGRLQMLPHWERALHDGVERARGRDWSKPTLDLVFYGDLFLKAGPGAKGPGDLGELDPDIVEFLERVQDEIVDPQEPVDVEAAVKGVKNLPEPAAALASWLERRFGLAGKLLFLGDLIQVRRYQREDSLAKEVLERTREALAARPRILVGHSLGSIVAHEALCLTPDHGVEVLVTLGSPLGLRSIRSALRPTVLQRIPLLPPGVARWVNIYDQRDPVALAGGLRSYWHDVVDELVDNGDDAHAIRRYLGKSSTGVVVAEALT